MVAETPGRLQKGDAACDQCGEHFLFRLAAVPQTMRESGQIFLAFVLTLKPQQIVG
jgi:hypothetical protein